MVTRQSSAELPNSLWALRLPITSSLPERPRSGDCYRMPRENAPDFSPLAAVYASTRPRYPDDLYAWLASAVDSHDVAWDSATGNGQAAVGMAGSFRRVLASDVSTAQLRHAVQHPRITYWAGHAEQSPLASGSVDLAVAAAAVHWFDLDAFSAEVRRVTRAGGVLAVWTYHVAHVEGEQSDLITSFYEDTVKQYFGPGARLVDARYEGLVLPGDPLDAPAFHVAADWTLDQLLGFVRSWSGVQKCTEETGRDPVVDLAQELAAGWRRPGEAVCFRWPLYLRATRL